MLFRSRYGGGHGDTAKRPEERKRWTEITDKYLQNYWSGLTYLSLESFVFYLPRIMIFLIDVEMERKQDFLDLFIFCIMNSFSRGSMPNLPSLLNAPQLEVVKQFILCSNRLTDDESILKMRSKIISQLKGNI